MATTEIGILVKQLPSLFIISLIAITFSCDKQIDRASELIMITKNETDYSVNVVFFPKKGRVQSISNFALAPHAQHSETKVFDAAIVPIGANFPFISYGDVDSIRITFDNSRFLSFERPIDQKECVTSTTIFCANNQSCVKQSSSKGECTLTITEAMFQRAKSF